MTISQNFKLSDDADYRRCSERSEINVYAKGLPLDPPTIVKSEINREDFKNMRVYEKVLTRGSHVFIGVYQVNNGHWVSENHGRGPLKISPKL